MDNNATPQTTTGWKVNDDWKGFNNFPKWKSFASQIHYLPYTIPQVQSRIDDAEPENMYNNAEGCGLPPILGNLFPTAGARKRLAEYQACVAGQKKSSQDLDSALADAIRAKANQAQSSGLSTGAILGISALVFGAVGAVVYFTLK